jgi:hypothetical protein
MFAMVLGIAFHTPNLIVGGLASVILSSFSKLHQTWWRKGFYHLLTLN